MHAAFELALSKEIYRSGCNWLIYDAMMLAAPLIDFCAPALSKEPTRSGYNWLIYDAGSLIDWYLCRQHLSQLWARRTTGSSCNWWIHGTTGRLIEWFLCRKHLSQLWARKLQGAAVISVADPFHFRVDPCLWLMDPDSDPDSDPDPGSESFYFRHWPSRCQQKTNFLTQFFLLMTFWSYIYIIFQR